MSQSDEGTRHGEVQCVWDTPWGTWTVLRDPGSAEYPRWNSQVWVCWICGNPWARECMLDGGKLRNFDVTLTPCGCQLGDYSYTIPGSLTCDTRWPLDAFDNLPIDLKRRECDVLLAWTASQQSSK